MSCERRARRGNVIALHGAERRKHRGHPPPRIKRNRARLTRARVQLPPTSRRLAYRPTAGGSIRSTVGIRATGVALEPLQYPIPYPAGQGVGGRLGGRRDWDGF